MNNDVVGNHRISFVGFGEAAQAFVSGWALERPDQIRAYDVKSDWPANKTGIKESYRRSGVNGQAHLADALAAAQVIFCTVTANRALEAAEAGAPDIVPGALWLDCNSCAPDTKRRAAAVIEQAGGRYADVAVMAAVHPRKHLVPLLVSGPHAKAACLVLTGLKMRPTIAGDTVGQASSIKMIRSVMIKGLEALTAECFLAARKAGVEEQVIASLEASDPDIKWRDRGAYNLGRMMVHGTRRAAEMREVAVTVDALGLAGRMSAATALWQDEIAASVVEPGEADLIARADRLLARL